MASKNPLTTATAKEYRTKYGKTMPNLKLARIMYNENKALFNSVDHARSMLRSVEGQIGAKSRNNRKDTALFTNAPRPKNPYNLPTSDKETFPNYIIKGHKKGLILNDIHFPYQDNEALTAALNYAKKEKPDLIILDLMLPKIDGYKVCAMLKFDKNYSSIPIIILTARAGESDKELGIEVRADADVTKPFEPDTFLDKVKEFIK